MPKVHINMQLATTNQTSPIQKFEAVLGEQAIEVTAVTVDGEPWFRGTDIASALGYAKSKDAVRVHVDDQDKEKLENLWVHVSKPELDHREAAQIFISESGMYSLILSSKKPEAKIFKRWITSVVLPAIRKTGSYSMNPAPSQTPAINDAQHMRRLALENDDLERRNIIATRQALLDIDGHIDAMQEWCIRDRLSNLLRPDSSSTLEGQTTHAGLYLIQDKGMTPSAAKKVRSLFGRYAAELKRRKDNLEPGAPLPRSLKNVEGNPTEVVVYRMPDDLQILEEAFSKLTQTSTYREATAARRVR